MIEESGELIVRVTSVDERNRHGYWDAIFSGEVITENGSVQDAASYVMVNVSKGLLCGMKIHRGEWWQVSGPVVERQVNDRGIVLKQRVIEARALMYARPSGDLMIAYIAGNPNFAGIGPVKARRLWNRFGNELDSIISKGQTQLLTEILSPEIAQRFVKAWQKQLESTILPLFAAYCFDVRLALKLIKFHGHKAYERIEEDPYRLLSFMGNWANVDRIAQEHFRLQTTDPRRLQGAIEEAGYRLFSQGHTLLDPALIAPALADLIPEILAAEHRTNTDRYLPKLASAFSSLLRDEPQASSEIQSSLSPMGQSMCTALKQALSKGSLLKSPLGLHLPGAMIMERMVAAAIRARLLTPGPTVSAAEVDALIAQVSSEDAIELNDEQKAAIHLAATERFACITGGAGVGKTTVLKTLYRLYDSLGITVIQVALAAKAARRMTEATHKPARTIAGFLNDNINQHALLPAVLVIDEASMVDIISMNRLCQEWPVQGRMLLVGDQHQLMPVGPGLVLHALTQIKEVPRVELTQTKRFAGQVANLAANIRAGQWKDLPSDPSASVAFIRTTESQIASIVVNLYVQDPHNTQILSAQRTGPVGTQTINQLCQDLLTKDLPEVHCWYDDLQTQQQRCALHENDIVLCTRNLWHWGLQNGSLGRITKVQELKPPSPDYEVKPSKQTLAWVDWDDAIGSRPLVANMLPDIVLGYAITIHKAQGSQWPRIIVPIQASRMLDRTLLYTAVTRAQKQVILVGDPLAARRAVVAPPRANSRKVALHYFLQSALQKKP